MRALDVLPPVDSSLRKARTVVLVEHCARCAAPRMAGIISKLQYIATVNLVVMMPEVLRELSLRTVSDVSPDVRHDKTVLLNTTHICA